MNRLLPRGLAAGAGYLAFAWFAALGMAQLTGSVAVLIVLGATAVAALLAMVAGGWRIARLEQTRVDVRPATHGAGGLLATGDAVDVIVTLRTRGGTPPRPVHVCVLDRGHVVVAGWSVDGVFEGRGTFARRGVIERLDVQVAAAGGPGLVWWRRRGSVAVDPIVVAPRPGGPGARISIVRNDQRGAEPRGAAGVASGGEVDGVRPWRDGDADHSVHWPTSLRTGALAVYDHRRDDDERWIVHVQQDADDPEAEAGRVRWAAEDGQRRGVVVSGDDGRGEPVLLADAAAVARWSASCVPDPAPPAPESRWRRIAHTKLGNGEPDDTLTPAGRWLVGLASAISLVMLTGALGSSPVTVAALIGGCTLTAAMTTGGTTRKGLKALVQVVVAAFTVAGLGAVVVSISDADDLLSVIRGPLPQVLMLLVVLHGFECTNRRAARASLAFSAVVATYAVGQRIDPSVPLWMMAWGAAWMAAVRAVGGAARIRNGDPSSRTATKAVSRARSRSVFARRFVASALTFGVAAVIAVALLGLVPVPDGPARLGLPASLETVRRAVAPSGIAGADGADTTTSGSRDPSSRSGSVGGYPGFDHAIDTSMRGDLGDEIVMRVRAPEPDFWRGQTFANFDGRNWTAIDDPGIPRPETNVELPPTFGDVERSTLVRTEQFVQTFYVEVDQPNILFGAYRPARVVAEGGVVLRSDGALRTDVTLTAGAVYTVVSERHLVTPAVLEQQGVVSSRLTQAGRDAFAMYLQVPDSTTDRTIELADQLATGSTSTYDLVRRMETWIRANVQYDLDAPVPPDGVDAVDDLLFGSQLGFCEQISSALAIMLRTQGVPTRIATGYVPGTRDRVTGVWEVRARDAHAWVEVWFPETGWQAFDPTADVPLAGESARESVGADLVRALSDAVRNHGRPLALAVLVLSLVAALVWGLLRHRALVRHRRTRGRWGLLQDRWNGAARERGIDDGCTNPELARRWSAVEPEAAATVSILADRLDRAAFDPAFDILGDDQAFTEALRLLESLEQPAARR